MQNLSYEKEFDSHENELVVEKHFHEARGDLEMSYCTSTRKTQGESHFKGRSSKMKWC